MEQPKSGSEQKVQEYIERIKGGESKESIMQGLPSSFVKSIENGLSPQDIKNIESNDAKKLKDIRAQLGLENNSEKEESKDEELAQMVESVCVGRKPAVVELYKELYEDRNNPESRKKLISALFQDVYNKYRVADYTIDPGEQKTWEYALNKKTVGIKTNSDWMYRGVFANGEEKTLTRGSFNVRVTPELVDDLDEMIASGKVKANYKFGQPGTQAGSTERHDAITIYFLEEPSTEVLAELGEIIRPYVREDNLLGRKVADGFYMSEVESIESEDVVSFVEQLRGTDQVMADAVKQWASPRPGQGTTLKMSEAQYYAVRDVAKVFGYDVSYNRETGFSF